MAAYRSSHFLVDAGSGRRHSLVSSVGRRVSDPHFSPDGNWVAFGRQISFTKDEIYLVRTTGGNVHCVTDGGGWLTGFAWNRDGQSLIAISTRGADKPEMWQFPVNGDSAPYRFASFDLGRANDLSVARRKGTMAWVRDLSSSSLWRMPIGKAAGSTERLVSSAGRDSDPEWSSVGQITFRSERSGSNEIWVARADGSDQRQATRFRGPVVGDPHWSPDGRFIAFRADPDGNGEIFVMACEQQDTQPCGAPRRLTRSSVTNANPTWSADGRSIYFSSNRSGRFEVWKIAAGGGEPVRITWNGGYVAHESADGQWLYYSKVQAGKGFWRIPLPAGGSGQREEGLVHDAPFTSAATWTLGPRELFYYPSQDFAVVRFPSIRALDIETRQARDVATGNTILLRGLSLSPDHQWLLRTQPDHSLCNYRCRMMAASSLVTDKLVTAMDACNESQQLVSRAVLDANNGTLQGPQQLIDAFYPELKRLAAAKMRRQPSDIPGGPPS